jgi:glycosyltransferase involved in cell wall biosynthesis
MTRQVCLISPGNLSSNPRLVKEANALHGAGYGVTVIACDYTDSLRPFDDKIAAGAPWKVRRVRRRARERYLNRGAHVLARILTLAGLRVPALVAANAYGGPASALCDAAREIRADLYIAHYVSALPAAADAARRNNAKLAFDAEDFHSGEGSMGAGEAFRMRMVEAVEEACLPACSYVSAASPLIGQAYAARYGVRPITVLNVFPLSMAPAPAAPALHAQTGHLSAYWFSQTIGLDRGLQAFVKAMASTKMHVSLDIRGSNRWGGGDALVALADELGIGDRIRLLPWAPPEDMVNVSAPYDLGLSLETDVSENRRICLTNKIFTYLLAGVPVMMSDTPAQSALGSELGSAAVVISLNDVERMAAELDRLADTPADLAAAKNRAFELGRQRYNWDLEQQVLLEAVAATFGQRTG